MSLHDDTLAVLAGWTPPSPDQHRLQQRYLRLLRRRPDALTRECRPDHLTASTLVLSADGRRVLLTLHAKAARWFQFGGHCEAGDRTLAAAALREAVEESGNPDLRLDPAPVQLSEHAVPFCGPDGDVHHLDVRFLAVTDDEDGFAASAESLDVRWWPADRLPTPDPDLAELVELARSRLAQSTGSPWASGFSGSRPSGEPWAADHPSR